MHEVVTYSALETQQVAHTWGVQLKAPAVVYLIGELGVGKTTFVQGLLKARGIEEVVTSPTFTLVESYEGQEESWHHFDLYRLVKPIELLEMGIEDYLVPHAVLLFEWPDKGGLFVPKPTVTIHMELINEETRRITMV